MIDKNKVIKGLECCLREVKPHDTNPCEDCPYYDIDTATSSKCIDIIQSEALALLKASKLVKTEHATYSTYEPTVDVDEDSEGTCTCNNCNQTIGWRPVDSKESIKWYMHCPGCGGLVNWEGVKK